MLALVAVLAGFASVMPLYPHKVFPFYDPAAYIFVADGMLNGRIPYVQLWENKGLPLYALNMLGRLMTPGHYTGIWLLELAFASLALWGVILTMRRFATLTAVLLASGLLVLGIVITAGGGDTPEFWNLPLQASGLAAAGVLISGEWRTKRWLLVLTGFAAGFSGMMKINLLGTWVALFILLVALTVSRRTDLSDALRALGFMAAGFIVAVALSVVPILAWGATGAWWDQWIGFGVNMSNHGLIGARDSRLVAVRDGLSRVMFVSATLAAGLLAAPIGWLARHKPHVDPKRIWMGGFLLCWLVIELWASSVNGLSYRHYSMPWLIPAVALIMLTFGDDTVRWPGLAFAGVVVALAIGYSMPLFTVRFDLHNGFPPVLRHEDASAHEAQALMIREVNQRTSPSDTILIWGMDPIVFTETGRLSAGPYSHPVDILLTPGYQSEARFAAFMSDLEAHPPRLIIDSARIQQNRPSILGLRVSEPTVTAVGRVEPYMSSLPDFLAARYRHVATTEPHVEYYELIGD